MDKRHQRHVAKFVAVDAASTAAASRRVPCCLLALPRECLFCVMACLFCADNLTITAHSSFFSVLTTAPVSAHSVEVRGALLVLKSTSLDIGKVREACRPSAFCCARFPFRVFSVYFAPLSFFFSNSFPQTTRICTPAKWADRADQVSVSVSI